MSGQKHLRIQKNGIFYTPEHIAALLAMHAINGGELSIFDPACGNGMLLLEALRVSKCLLKKRPLLVGCDRFKQKNIDTNIKFIHSDFFKLKVDKKHDLILTNPPYIQSARINPTMRNKYYAKYAQPLCLSSNLDYWVYFLVKSAEHLKVGGSIAAVLPWAFLEAEYAQSVRKWIAEKFEKISVVVLRDAHFKETAKRVLLIWMQNYGVGARCIKLGHTNRCDSIPDFGDFPLDVWNSKNAMVGLTPETNNIQEILREKGFKPFAEYASVHIGVVTGANDYFIRPKEEAAELGFSGKDTLRILTSAHDLRKAILEGTSDKVLIQFNRMSKKKKKYIHKGYRSGLNKRVHCIRRKKQTGLWYKINQGFVPDAFFSYRASTIPYLIQNPDSFQCTNTLHRIKFKDVSEAEKQWIQISILSIFGQFLLETKGRHYGNGIIKIEPTALKNILVYVSKKLINKNIFKEIIETLCNGDKEAACFKATQLIVREAKIKNEFVKEIIESLNDIRKLRGAKSLKSEINILAPKVN